MGNKPNFAAGGSTLARHILGYVAQKRNEEQRQLDRQFQYDNSRDLINLRNDNMAGRDQAQRDWRDGLAEEERARANAPVFGEGAVINGMAVPESFQGLSPDDLNRAMAMNKFLLPPEKTGAPRTTVIGRDGEKYSIPDPQALVYNNPEPLTPDNRVTVTDETGTYSLPASKGYDVLHPDDDVPPGPIDTYDSARQMFGSTDDKTRFDTKTREAIPYEAHQRGQLFDPGTSPLSILPELSAAYDDSVNVSGRPEGRATAGLAKRDVMAGFDEELANKMGADLAKSLDGWVYDEKKQQYKHPNGFWGRAKYQPSAKFYSDIIEPLLADGTDKVEFDTIKSWLKKNKYTLEELVSGLSPESLEAISSQDAPDGPQIGDRKTLSTGKVVEFVGGAEQWAEAR